MLSVPGEYAPLLFLLFLFFPFFFPLDFFFRTFDLLTYFLSLQVSLVRRRGILLGT